MVIGAPCGASNCNAGERRCPVILARPTTSQGHGHQKRGLDVWKDGSRHRRRSCSSHSARMMCPTRECSAHSPATRQEGPRKGKTGGVDAYHIEVCGGAF